MTNAANPLTPAPANVRRQVRIRIEQAMTHAEADAYFRSRRNAATTGRLPLRAEDYANAADLNRELGVTGY